MFLLLLVVVVVAVVVVVGGGGGGDSGDVAVVVVVVVVVFTLYPSFCLTKAALFPLGSWGLSQLRQRRPTPSNPQSLLVGMFTQLCQDNVFSSAVLGSLTCAPL